MACKEWNEQWIARLYGELDPPAAEEAARHLGRCESCRAKMDELEVCRTLLAESAPGIPEAPRLRVLESRPRLGVAWSFAAGLACAALLFVAGVVAARVSVAASEDPLSRAELARALEAQRADLDRRLDEHGRSLAAAAATEERPAALTRDDLEREFAGLRHSLEAQREQDLDYLLGEIAATEVRTGTWIGETQQALRYVALQNDPRFRER